MKKQIALVALLFLGMSCFNASAQFKKFNLGKAIQAGKDAAQAISLSDADIAAMSKEYMEWMDKHNPLTKPDSEYGKRLERLTGNIKEAKNNRDRMIPVHPITMKYLKNYVNDIRYGVNFLTKEDEEELDILLEKIDDKIQSEEHKKRTELSEARLLFEY